MARPEFIVQPQRSDGRAWVPCELHRATVFAVVRVEHFTRKGRKFKSSRVVERCHTKTNAESIAAMHNKRYEPTPRHLVRKLGVRIIAP